VNVRTAFIIFYFNSTHNQHLAILNLILDAQSSELEGRRPRSSPKEALGGGEETEDWDAEVSGNVQTGYDPSIKMKEGAYL